MADEKIRILISVIGKYNDHVDHFIREKGRYLKKVYLFHTIDSKEPQNRDGRTNENNKTIDYGKLAKKFIKKLENKHDHIKIIPVVYDDAHDIHELQIKIQNIVNDERVKYPQLDEIALDISGGTNIAAAAQIFAVYKFHIVPYYDDSRQANGERIKKIDVDYDLDKALSSIALKHLKIISNSKFIVKPDKEDKQNPLPDWLPSYMIDGQITKIELEKQLGKRSSASSLKLLVEKNLIEEIHKYDYYYDAKLHETDEPKWEKRTHNRPAFKITPNGRIKANLQKYQS
jgi:hypothetical protein